MLPLTVVQEIQRLLREKKVSQRQIAKELGVARGTVDSIASGKRGGHGRTDFGRLDSQTPESDPSLERGRCPECGVVGYVPCVACRAWEFRRRQLPDESRAA